MERGKKRQYLVLLKLSESIKNINYTQAHCTSSGYERFRREALLPVFQMECESGFLDYRKTFKISQEKLYCCRN